MTVTMLLPTVSQVSTDYLAANSGKAVAGVNVVQTSTQIDPTDEKYNISTAAPITSFKVDKNSVLIVSDYVANDYPGVDYNSLDLNLIAIV